MMRSIRPFATACSAACIAAGVLVGAQAPDLDVLKIRDNVYMIAGAGANVTVEFGGDGAVVVDAGVLQQADAVVAAIRTITPQPIRYVIAETMYPEFRQKIKDTFVRPEKCTQTCGAPAPPPAPPGAPSAGGAVAEKRG